MKNLLTSIACSLLMITASAQVEKISFDAPYVYPEGVAYDAASGNFLVSSVRTGTIGKVDRKGNYSVLYEDASLKSTFGMKVNAKLNQLFVCSADPNYSLRSDSSTFKKMAKVLIIDLSAGKKIKEIDLAGLISGKHFPNDLAFDEKGNAYITDSFAAAIYKIDSKGQASVFAKSDLFKSIDVGINGIVVHPSGYLLVDHSSNGSIYKVMLNDPSKITVVKMPSFFPGADGMTLDDKNNLVLVQQKGVDKVYLIISTDQWASAKVDAMTFTEDRFQQPTTVAWTKEGAFVLNSKMNELGDSTRSPSKTFSIQKAMFKPAN